MPGIHPDDIASVIRAVANDDQLYDRFINATELLANPGNHDGHVPEALTVERLAADIAAAA